MGHFHLLRIMDGNWQILHIRDSEEVILRESFIFLFTFCNCS